MPSDELDATTDVITLAGHIDGLGESVAQRLDDNGIETVADILIVERETLTDIPYVSGTRADLLHRTAERIAGDDVEPREIDFDATESVVSEATSVTRVDAEQSDEASEMDADPLVDPREVALEATLGEKLNLTMANRDGYACEWAVVDTEEPTTWETPTGDTWQTRRIRISQKMSGAEHYSECDLVVAGNEIRLEDPPVKRRAAHTSMLGWEVESVGAVGRVERSTLAQLQGRQQERDAKPEGDDSWRKYQHRGETA